jgi:hypothetical protein
MLAFFKRMRLAALVAGYIVVASVCQLFRIAVPMDSFLCPHNLRRFRPYYVVPRTVCYLRAMDPLKFSYAKATGAFSSPAGRSGAS